MHPRGCKAVGSITYNHRCCCQRLASLKELMMSQLKIWIFSFLSSSFGNDKKLSKNCIFLTFGPKQCFYLTHSAREYFEKLGFKKKQKNATLKRFLSKARASSESKLTFSESYFYFLQNRVGFCALYSRGYMAGGFAHYNPHCCCQRVAWVKELMMSL